MLWNFANGHDNSPVSNIGTKSLIKNVGNSTTTPHFPSCTSEDIFNKAFELYKTHHTSRIPIRSLAVKACNLITEETIQLSFMPEVAHTLKVDNLEHAVDSIGNMTPMSIIWEDGRIFEIDKILDKRQAASLKAGGQGIRYTCKICNKQTYLFYENPNWFVVGK